MAPERHTLCLGGSGWAAPLGVVAGRGGAGPGLLGGLVGGVSGAVAGAGLRGGEGDLGVGATCRGPREEEAVVGEGG